MLKLLWVTVLTAGAQAPVSAVTVFSEGARITRVAPAPGTGVRTVELPLLPDSVDPSTLQVEAGGAELRTVDIAHADADAFAPTEALKLLGDLDKLDTELDRARGEQRAHAQALAWLARVTPTVNLGEPLRPPPRLNAGGWSASLGFLNDTAARWDGRSRELQEKSRQLEEARATLAARASILGATRPRSGYRVTATLAGPAGTVTVRYLVRGASWIPGYEIRLFPEKARVEVSFLGEVTQLTGEDWTDAQLTLSTALPAAATQMPKVASWRIGEKERFLPVSHATQAAPTARPPIGSPQAPPPPRRSDEDLRKKLIGAVEKSANESAVDLPRPEQPPSPSGGYAGEEIQVTGSRIRRRGLSEAAPTRVTSQEEQIAVSDELAPSAAPAAPVAPMSLAPPPAYAFIPRAGSPMALAGGYDLAYPSARPESVGSGKGARQVALFTRSLPVTVDRWIYPAISPESYLVADIVNPLTEPLPGGEARLFVGGDASGTALLKLVAPGERFSLPLGVDPAVKSVRNVKLVESEQGFIGKDDVSEYDVTVELSNPYRFPASVRVYDQWPVTQEKQTEITLLKTEPYAIQDKVKGTLEWHLTVPPTGKASCTFRYSIRRPKGWRLHEGVKS